MSLPKVRSRTLGICHIESFASSQKTFPFCIGGLSSGVEMDMLMTKQRNTRNAVFEQAYPKSALSILH